MYAQAEQENSDICICEAGKYDNAKEKYIPSDAYLKEDLLPGKQTLISLMCFQITFLT